MPALGPEMKHYLYLLRLQTNVPFAPEGDTFSISKAIYSKPSLRRWWACDAIAHTLCRCERPWRAAAQHQVYERREQAGHLQGYPPRAEAAQTGVVQKRVFIRGKNYNS